MAEKKFVPFPHSTLKTIQLSKIKCVREYYHRNYLDLFQIREMQDNAQRIGLFFDPPVVAEEKATPDSYILIDGWHRFEALKALGVGEYNFQVMDIEPKDYLITAIRIDIEWRPLPLTKQEIENSMLTIWKKDEISIPEIAQAFHMPIGGAKTIIKNALRSQGLAEEDIAEKFRKRGTEKTQRIAAVCP